MVKAISQDGVVPINLFKKNAFMEVFRYLVKRVVYILKIRFKLGLLISVLDWTILFTENLEIETDKHLVNLDI